MAVMSEPGKQKQKEISKGEAAGIAKELVRGLSDGSDWAQTLAGLERLPLSQRRMVVEASREVTVTGPVDGRRLLAAARLLLRPTSTFKAEVMLGMLGAVFELCMRLEARSDSHACGELLAELLLARNAAPDSGLPDVTKLDPKALSGVEPLMQVLRAMLASPEQTKTLRGSLKVWGQLVGLSIGQRGSAGRFRQEEARAVLELIAGQPTRDIAPELMLAIPWLATQAGGIPRELSNEQPFAALPDGLKASNLPHEVVPPIWTGAVEGGDGDRLPSSGLPTAYVPIGGPSPPRPVVPAPPDPAALPGKLGELLGQLAEEVREQEASERNRRSELSRALKRSEEELEESRRLLARVRSELGEVRRRQQDLVSRCDASEARCGGLVADLETERARGSALVAEVGMLIESHRQQQLDVAIETKREMKRITLSQLQNLRGYIQELSQGSELESARFAAVTFDQVARLLQKLGYLTADELPGINTQK